MEIVIYLAIFMIIVGCVFLCLFLFGVRRGQFDDLQTPAHKILLDDEVVKEKKDS